MQKRRSTVEDVARAAGVSLMTVSRAMNRRPGLSDETRRRVLAAAADLGYRPSRAARALASSRTATFGIVLPDMTNPFFAILAKAASDAARSADRNVFVMNTDEDPGRELASLESLREEGIDGVIVAGSRLPQARLLEETSAFGATVLVNRDCSGPRLGCVNVEDRQGAAEAVAYLAGTGRRRIGLIAGPRTATGARRRLAGYRDGLGRSGLAFREEWVERCAPTLEGGAEATRRLVARAPGIDAILAYNDIVAIGALRALDEAGRAVPSDIAVMGTDDVPYASIAKPALSTVHSDIPRLGAEAMNLLLALSSGEDAPEYPPQIPRIIVREST